jgi:hypothetical protein
MRPGGKEDAGGVNASAAEMLDLSDRLHQAEDDVLDLLWRVCDRQALDGAGDRVRLIRTLLSGNDDLVTVPLPRQGPAAGQAIFLGAMVDPEVVHQNLAGALARQGHATNVTATQEVGTYGDAVRQILVGRVLVLADGRPRAVAFDARGYKTRAIDPPVLQTVARGPQEGFIEDLEVNISMIRRRLRDPRLVFEPLTIGALSRTPVRLAYVRGLANGAIVAEARDRLRRVSLPMVLDTNYIEEAIQDDPYSPFPQMLFSERPDVVVAALVEGRFAILVDGTSNALIAPVTFWSFLQSPDDYYQRYPSGTFIRLMRLVLHLFAMLMPAVYIALTTFHQQMLPTALMETIMRARQGVPFPAVVEAFIMEISFEVLREAALRLPQKLGTSLSVVGALVLGQAAVYAGLVSWPVVVIVAVTAITNFSIPQWDMALAIRLIRFSEMVAAALFGLPGIMVLNVGLLLHVTDIRSFGIPYFTPISPLDPQALADVVVRLPHWVPHPRPRYLSPGWLRRVRPGHRPHQPRKASTAGRQA